MEIDSLVRMANRIGDFFDALPDADEAHDGVANHLKRFWEPRMRAEILRHLDATGGAGLKPVVIEALKKHRALLAPAQAA